MSINKTFCVTYKLLAPNFYFFDELQLQVLCLTIVYN